ncbi:hypothetical protein [Rothia sp. ZJ932]|uniref:hypothetical protein n=1 Tax=Rothia sp. ZJ932 TaxID=2810516 RepID=UPI001967FB7C|nr:hypothetical protein [Rothia sp. ZJ932]QRZ61823.1 hypothetical protein JR346_01380 [Rothia sp. ZJ932]
MPCNINTKIKNKNELIIRILEHEVEVMRAYLIGAKNTAEEATHRYPKTLEDFKVNVALLALLDAGILTQREQTAKDIELYIDHHSTKDYKRIHEYINHPYEEILHSDVAQALPAENA